MPVSQCTQRVSAYPRRVQRHALGILFAVLAAALTAIAAYAFAGGSSGRHLVIGFAALAVAAWLATLSAGAFRRKR